MAATLESQRMNMAWALAMISACVGLFVYMIINEDFLMPRVDKRQNHGKIKSRKDNNEPEA